MSKTDSPFKSEAEMCAQFIAALGNKWLAYAETAGWDILLVRKSDGFQIGVQAKLRFNAKVIDQALEQYHGWSVTAEGPDCRVVLVPESQATELGNIADYCGITVIGMRAPLSAEDRKWIRRGNEFSPDLPEGKTDYIDKHWHELCPTKRCKLPAYVPDVTAGASAPIQLTDWKIKALRIAVTIAKRGFVTREDFKHHKIDHRRWITPGAEWLLKNGEGGYVTGRYMPNFKKQHPDVYKQVEKDAKKWMLDLKKATQPRLL